jgi:hypothetical protein
MWLCSTFARRASGAVVLAAVEEDAGAGHPRQRGLHGVQLVDELPQRPLIMRDALAVTRAGGLLPRAEDGEHDDADQQRQPRSVDDLGQVGREEEQVDGEQHAAARHGDPERRAPLLAGDVEEQQGGDRDRAGHGRAVGVGQRV